MNLQNLTIAQNGASFTPSAVTLNNLSNMPAAQATYCFNHKSRAVSQTVDQRHKTIMKEWNAIPVCLVTSDQQGKTAKVSFPSGAEDVLIPIDEKNKRPALQTEENTTRDLTIFDYLGIYLRRSSKRQDRRQVIFILVDKIMETADTEHYETLVAQVILHEMMHAMMDVDTEVEDASKCKNVLIKKDAPEYYHNAEEALANALSIMFLATFCNDMDFIWDFVRSQPKPYCQAEEVMASDQSLMMNATHWIGNKMSYDKHHRAHITDYKTFSKTDRIPVLFHIRDKEFNSLTTLPIHEGCQGIESDFFNSFGGIKTLTTPDSVTRIATHAFRNCEGLREVVISKHITDLEAGAICDCPNIEKITVEEGNPRYYSDGNCVIEKETGVLVLGCKNSVIPKGVKGIGVNAFGGCMSLTNITIPDSVKWICDLAFVRCDSLTNLTIPASVERIMLGSFYSCKELESITFEGNPELYYQCFAQCRNLKSVNGLSDRPISADKRAFFVSDETAQFNIKGGIEFCDKLGI